MNDAACAEAMALHQAGQFAEAAALYRIILGRDPNHADSLHLLGLITAEQDDPQAGIALIRRAMAIDPNRAVHHHSLGHAYRRLGRMEDAVCEYRTAAALLPEAAEIHNNLGNTLRDLGRHQEAITHYRRAVALAPGATDTWYNLANALAETGPLADIEICYRKAIELKPEFAYAQGNYGRWLMTQGRWAEAEAALAKTVRLAPRYAAGWNHLGVVLQELGRIEAEASYQSAIEMDPGMAGAHYNLGRLRFEQGRGEDALACFEVATKIDPGFGIARLAACMSQIPILYRTQDEVAQCRDRYTKALQGLVAGDIRSLADAIGIAQPFFLPYQGRNDRTLQATYGEFVCRVLAETEPAEPLAARPVAGERIRLGIVSGFFCDHTLLKLFLEGWLTQLDRSRFQVTGFHTGRVTDAQTARCADLCDRFVHGLPSGAAWREAISAAAPHVLLYPEIGIDPMAGRLAAIRLAPVQCVTWGHPETTGMPTIDYFLSSELMEPPDGDSHYTERLVRLPHLGLCYTPDAPADVGPAIPPGVSTPPRVAAPPRVSTPFRVMTGLGPVTHDVSGSGAVNREQPACVRHDINPLDPPVFWSGQALYKYLPQYDAIFPRIAIELGACRFVFVAFAKSRAVTVGFRDRLWQAFAAAGLDAARHVVILPPMSQCDYMDAVGQADVILDTPGWSGGKSTLDCLAVDPAIVTWPGHFMRGRHTAAILRRIGCEATIAGSADEYVSIAVRLARDPVWRAAVRQAVACGKHHAYGDVTYIRALETFLIEATYPVSPARAENATTTGQGFAEGR